MQTHTCDRCGKENIGRHNIANLAWSVVLGPASRYPLTDKTSGELELCLNCLATAREALRPVKAEA